MGLHWRADSEARLVLVVAKGPVTDRDFLRCLAAVRGAGASEYKKLLDCSDLNLVMGVSEALAVGSRIRAGYDDPMGPLAVVMPANPPEVLTRLLGILATANRPMRLFSTKRKARHWLDKVSPVEPLLEVSSSASGFDS